MAEETRTAVEPDCNGCKFSVAMPAGNSHVLCRRYPQEQTKGIGGWCGEWIEGKPSVKGNAAAPVSKPS